MTADQKHWIDNASYHALLEKWRNAPSGDPMFTGEAGVYYSKVMSERREKVGAEQHTATSKDIGWDG